MKKVTPKSITVVPATTMLVKFLNETHPIEDNPGMRSDKSDRELKVRVNGSQLVVCLKGSDYDAFYTKYGDGYTSEDVNEMLMEKLGLTAAQA